MRASSRICSLIAVQLFEALGRRSLRYRGEIAVTPQIAMVLGILALAVVLFVTERLRMDVVALLVLVGLALTASPGCGRDDAESSQAPADARHATIHQRNADL